MPEPPESPESASFTPDRLILFRIGDADLLEVAYGWRAI